MVRFRIPSSLRAHTGGRESVVVEGGDLSGALKELAREYPECGRRLLDASGRPREWVRILGDGEVLSILPAVPGG